MKYKYAAIGIILAIVGAVFMLLALNASSSNDGITLRLAPIYAKAIEVTSSAETSEPAFRSEEGSLNENFAIQLTFGVSMLLSGVSVIFSLVSLLRAEPKLISTVSLFMGFSAFILFSIEIALGVIVIAGIIVVFSRIGQFKKSTQ